MSNSEDDIIIGSELSRFIESFLKYNLPNNIINVYKKCRRLQSLFEFACTDGQLKVAQLVYELSRKDKKININAGNECCFRWACASGNFELVKWLYETAEIDNMKINIHADNDCSFRWTCSNGHMIIAMWLYNLSKTNNDNINIHANNEYAFQWSCINNHFAVASWLYEQSKKDNTKININANNDFAFRLTCKTGHFNIVKWLYELSQTDNNIPINIYANNDCAFRFACINNHQEIAEWLCSLSKKYRTKIKCGQLIACLPDLKTILKENISDEINKLIDKNLQKSEVNCMICLDDGCPYWTKLDCGHEVCANCYVNISKCPLRCNNSINNNKVKIFCLSQ